MLTKSMESKMNQEILEKLKQRFINYVQTFQSDDPQTQQSIILKQEHTKRVCREILMLGKQLDLKQTDLYLAEVMALFHDIGRFEQYVTYHTFVDCYSVNHAELGVNILRKRDMLDILDKPTQNLILRVISYHNRARLPQDETETCLFFTKLLRDADKLDIWRVVIEYYYSDDGNRNEAISLGLPDTPEISAFVCEDLLAKRIVDANHLRTLSDFKLLQIGWIYDINFVLTLQIVQERQYLEQIRATLSPSKKLEKVFETIYDYMEEKKNRTI
jgi:putative nucleotidyltransferase with HDIG domain